MWGLSTSLTEMIIFRAFQGMGGASLPSVAQTYISTSFKNEEYNKMMTISSLWDQLLDQYLVEQFLRICLGCGFSMSMCLFVS